MNSIKSTRKDVKKSFSKTYKEFMKLLKNSKSKDKDFDKDNIQWFLSYGFFVKKAKTPQEKAEREIKQNNEKSMLFDERLEYNLSKVRVNVTMKAKNFTLTDRVYDEEYKLPTTLLEIISEDIKLKMRFELIKNPNEDILNSIPKLNEELIDPQSIQLLKMLETQVSGGIVGSKTGDEDSNTEEKINEILDKIAENGIESLSDKEREFLDSQSK